MGKVVKDFYSTLAEASVAAVALGITTSIEYRSKRHRDRQLPASPDQIYKEEWQGWPSFLGKEPKQLYPTLAEASAAAIALGIATSGEYQAKRHRDRQLPVNPGLVYKEEWQGWPLFLGRQPKQFYPTLAEASSAAIALGIRTSVEYQAKKRRDRQLPSDPERKYKEEWQGWPSFLGKESKQFYSTLAEASAAAIALGITTSGEYQVNRHRDRQLPANPDQMYKEEWQGLPSFLGRETKQLYPTLAEASSAAIALGITTLAEYKVMRLGDRQLPASPNLTYKEEWQGWPLFLGREPQQFYPTLAEASVAAIALGITTSGEYQAKRHRDRQLSADPSKMYKEDWQAWPLFLLPKRYKSLADVKQAVKVLDIKDSREYRKKLKLYSVLPSHPDRQFKTDWVDWYDLCDIPKPYTYDEAVALIALERLTSKREYIDYIVRSSDRRLPRTPDQVYKSRWVNWYVYLGRREPYKTKNIRAPYTQWAMFIQNFLKGARGGKSKESHLCRFVRHYIQAYEMGECPLDFLTKKKKDIRPFKEWLTNNEAKLVAHKILTSVNEFLDFIIQEYLTDEDKETGELVLVPNTHNPFSNIVVDYSCEKERQPSETTKCSLAYQYVNAAKKWIVPEKARSFSDLTHLQKFNADWFDIDIERIDVNDPNCVTRKSNGKTQIWFPVFWIHTYALMSVPARGMQLAYCDSGEADDIVPVISESDSIEWEANQSKLAGLTKCQGFVRCYDDGALGMYFTSNKTSSSGRGYDVAWIPEELAYWVIQLRNWQSKYNPISRPMPWLECKRTSLNENQRIYKGSNCFLFRDFDMEEPGHFSGRLASRLSASLYHTQPSDLELASLLKDETVLSHYSSDYTPHSMRVSLITAYVEQFGLPLPVIMKVAGHSSIVMTIYYLKTGSEYLRRRFSEGEKRAMQNKSYAAQQMIEQGRIDEIKNELIATSSDALNLISNETPVGTYLFRDYGICPYGGDRCSDGGDIIQSSKIRSAVPVGYLGSQNCIACRHFISGPAFIGGLLSLGNEVSLASHLQYEQYDDLEQQLKQLNEQINDHDDAAYDAELRGEDQNLGLRNNLELQKRKTLSEIEAAAKKLDSLLCDMNKVSRLIKQCQALVNQDVELSDEADVDSRTKLILQKDHELQVNYEDTSRFKQLSEVCENAEIYQSASSEMALAPRSQMIDKMALRNKLPVHMFTLDKKQQLVVGNQITRLMLDRLKSWRKVDALVDGRICLSDLAPDERITKQDFLRLKNPDADLNYVEKASGELL
ncbi:integrase [Aestuariicella sp. G3-2]|uniref:gamma-mobile-trio integrase GmtZ n=1 Tax=Pseudomaricurvus albidus TaxID=2842452 RepID=UPI001C0E7F23|nr:integrase [Aestuariicella albida]